MSGTAVVVSRMNRDLGEVIESLRPWFDEIVIVKGKDGVSERWDRALHARCTSGVVYVQDDDCIVDVGAVVREFDARVVTCNMPADHRADYPDQIALVGWGCIFDRKMVDVAFRRYWSVAITRGRDWDDETLRREADRVFTGLSPLKLIDVPVRHLDVAHGQDRMSLDKLHGTYLAEIRRRIYAVRSAIPGA